MPASGRQICCEIVLDLDSALLLHSAPLNEMCPFYRSVRSRSDVLASG
jgi:hypothetical protein